MPKRICDARYMTDDAGVVGRQTVIVENAPPVSIPVGGCSSDVIAVWHGMETPAYGCGKHVNANGMSFIIFKGHRNREAGVQL